MRTLILGAALTLACSGGSAATDDNNTQGDTASAGDDTTSPSDDSSTSGGDTDPSGADTSPVGTDTPGGDTPVSTGALRFVAVGDTGKGNDGQKQVADAIAAKCAKDGCDFVQLLGDNIYDSGVSSTSDPQWTTKFETPYGGISLPFYVVLGNHDYGGNGTGNEFGKGQFEVDYTAKSMKWKLPSNTWSRSSKGVDMFGLDTNLIMYNRDVDKQKAAFNAWVGSAKGFKIAFGHHPYLSNGPHGNAGTYEGIPFIPVTSGQTVKDFMDSTLCGKVDVYICGHDHSRQWIKTTCKGTELIVSGGGSAPTELKGSNPTYYQANTIGFLYAVVEGNKFTGEWIDATGKSEFTRTFTKP